MSHKANNINGTNVLLLYGSVSGEDIPSKMTKDHVGSSLSAQGFNITDLHFNKDSFIEDIKKINPNIVFICMHGRYGEDGRVQSVLDLLQIPYTHDNHYVSSVGFNKDYTKRMMQSVGVPVANWTLSKKEEILTNSHQDNPIFKNGYIIKPNCSGSTLGICVRYGANKMTYITESDFTTNDNLFLMEEFIPGREFAVLVFENSVLGTIELTSNHDDEGNIISYNDKYIDMCERKSPEVSKEIMNRLNDYALKTAQVIGSKCLSRVDFRVNDLDKSNVIIAALEVNTHPGLGTKSMFANICNQNGVSMDDIFMKLVLNAKHR